MDCAEPSATTMHNATRTLLQVKVEEAALADEITSLLDFVLSVLRAFGFEEFTFNLSTKDPEKYVGSDEIWDEATENLVHRENTEEACRGCHGDNHGFAVAESCASCHLAAQGTIACSEPADGDGAAGRRRSCADDERRSGLVGPLEVSARHHPVRSVVGQVVPAPVDEARGTESPVPPPGAYRPRARDAALWPARRSREPARRAPAAPGPGRPWPAPRPRRGS